MCDVTLLGMEQKTPHLCFLRCGLHCRQECTTWNPKCCALVFKGYPWPVSHQAGTWKYTAYMLWRAWNHKLIFKWALSLYWTEVKANNVEKYAFSQRSMCFQWQNIVECKFNKHAHTCAHTQEICQCDRELEKVITRKIRHTKDMGIMRYRL